MVEFGEGDICGQLMILSEDVELTLDVAWCEVDGGRR